MKNQIQIHLKDDDKETNMKIKKPSLKGMKNTGYLGHFAQDKYIQQGHNFSGKVPMKKSDNVRMWTAVTKKKDDEVKPGEQAGPYEVMGPDVNVSDETISKVEEIRSRAKKQRELTAKVNEIAARARKSRERGDYIPMASGPSAAEKLRKRIDEGRKRAEMKRKEDQKLAEIKRRQEDRMYNYPARVEAREQLRRRLKSGR